MSDLKDFLNSKLLRHPATWLLVAGAGTYGGIEMLQIREANRAAGAALHWPYLWMEQSVDFAFGALVQILFVMCALWAVAGWSERYSTWLQLGLLTAIYLGLVGLRYFL
jgi:hypothetical protein